MEAMRRFDSRRQSDTESLAEYETALRILYKEVWPDASSMELVPWSYCNNYDCIIVASTSQKLLSRREFMRQQWTVRNQRRLYALLR